MTQKTKALNGAPARTTAAAVTAEELHRMIAEAAYYHALNRVCNGGSAEDDWLQAEQEINRALRELQTPRDKRHTRSRTPATQARPAS